MSQHYNPPPPPTSRVRPVLFAVWAALSLAAIAYVTGVGSNAPAADEWAFVPALTGHEPVVPWLWAQHNEHRLPLPRVIYLTLFAAAHDFRVGMLLQVASLSALSFGLMRLAARFRGRPDWADVFFPVSLLHIGHWENFLMGYQFCFVLVTLLATAVGVLALRATPANAFRTGVGAGVIACLLALCGGTGLVVGLPVAGWVAFLAAGRWRAGSRGKAVALLVLAALPVLYLPFYFTGYQRPAHHPVPGDGGTAVAMVAGEVLAMALGISVSPLWQFVLVGILALGTATVAVLARSLKSPAERPAAAGLLALIAGVCGLALAIGVGRAGLGAEMGLWSRYALLTWPLLGVAFLFWVKRGNRAVPLGLAAAAALAFPGNMGDGMVNGAAYRGVVAAFEADVRAGVPPELAARRLDDSYHAERDHEVIPAVPMMRDAGIGPFAADLSRFVFTVIGFVVLALGGRWLWHLGHAVQIERARELFRLQHERFEGMLLAAARDTGKPRNLTWAGCEIAGDAVLAREAATRRLVALVPVVIRFDPVPGSDMEDVPAAKEPRRATAVFTFVEGHWHTDGRVLFNLDPRQAAGHYGEQLRMIEGHG